MSHTDTTTSKAVPPHVQVTVTTLRTDLQDGCRQATAEGPFDAALDDALAQRLTPWAAEQVRSTVLARRPAAGEPIEYEDAFCPARELHISIRPVGPVDPAAKPKVRRLPGLFIPAALHAAAGAAEPGKVVAP
jgi:hypothetical protein